MKSPSRWATILPMSHVEGALHEVGLWLKRTGFFEPLLENRAVLLSNGRLAVESANAALFVSGNNQNADTFSFDNPCPPVNERIAPFDADAALSSSPAFVPVSTLPCGSLPAIPTISWSTNTP